MERYRVPTDQDVKDLEMHLGMSQAQADSEGDWTFRGTNEGSKIAGKSTLWDSGALKSDGDFGDSGINIVASGACYTNGYIEALTLGASIWSSTLDGVKAYNRDFYYTETGISRIGCVKGNGFSIYLVRDLELGEDADANGTVYEDDYTGNDGKTYNAVKQGDQIWLNEPLKETKFRDDTLITLASNASEWSTEVDNSDPVRREPNDDDTKVDDYGYLYSFYTIESSKGLVALHDVPEEYPYQKYTARTIENDPSVTYDETQKTVIFAEDVEKLNEQVKQIQDVIGVLTEMQAKTIFERLDDLET